LRLLTFFEAGSSLSGAFEIVDQVDLQVLEKISHDYKVPDLSNAVTVHPKDSVQAVEPADQAVRVLLKELEIGF
jgi:hypothetical protein